MYSPQERIARQLFFAAKGLRKGLQYSEKPSVVPHDSLHTLKCLGAVHGQLLVGGCPDPGS
jgi:hypothetical protein